VEGDDDFDHDDDTFSKPGTAAHALAAACFNKKHEPWQYIGAVIDTEDFIHDLSGFGSDPDGVKAALAVKDAGTTVDKEMADAVQEYLSAVALAHPDRNQGNCWVERKFHCPTLHKLFYGTSDLVYLDKSNRVLHVWDYKHGAGIIIEVKENEQTMYYACGVLEDLQLWAEVDMVVLHIAQPRGFHFDGPIRKWAIRTVDLEAWLDGVLIPAMGIALVSRDTKSGEHCRFCPARSRACPQLLRDMDEMEKLMAEVETKGADKLTNAQLARFLDLFDVAKIIHKAAEKTAFARLSAGHDIPNRKLANKRANRVWNAEAEGALVAKFGDDAWVTKLKSPAMIEQMAEGEAFAARYAYKPVDAGLTVVKGQDTRPAVNKDTKSLFTDQTKKGRK
jgi:hypothetical protein